MIRHIRIALMLLLILLSICCLTAQGIDGTIEGGEYPNRLRQAEGR